GAGSGQVPGRGRVGKRPRGEDLDRSAREAAARRDREAPDPPAAAAPAADAGAQAGTAKEAGRRADLPPEREGLRGGGRRDGSLRAEEVLSAGLRRVRVVEGGTRGGRRGRRVDPAQAGALGAGRRRPRRG